MKTSSIILFPAAFLLLFLCEGCVAIRIANNRTAFDSLTPGEQANIKQGRVAVGYTEDMVYMALGTPGNVMKNDVTNEVTWEYTQHSTPMNAMDGNAHAYISHNGTVQTFIAPPRPTIVRIDFFNGKVVRLNSY